MAPGNPEVLSLIEKAEQESQLHPVDSDLANRIAQFKAESLKFFEHGRYSECVQRFKLLTELDPENYDLRDYLQISIEEAEKQKRSHPNVTITPTQENRDDAPIETSTPDVLVNCQTEPFGAPSQVESQELDTPEQRLGPSRLEVSVRDHLNSEPAPEPPAG